MATSANRNGWALRLPRPSHLHVLVGALALCAACQTTPRASTSTRRLDRTVITRDEMLKGNYTNLFDAVAALHSNWLQARGVADSPTNVIWVYVDGAKVGDVGVLKEMRPSLVNTVRFYDGPSATSRWGVDNAAGVIHVSTWSDGATGIPLPDSTRARPKPPGRS